MKRIVIFFCAAGLFAWSIGCVGKISSTNQMSAGDPAEMHVWLPPDEELLEERRAFQAHLDEIEAEIERLFLIHEEELGFEENLRSGIQEVPPRIANIESQISYKIADENHRAMIIEREIALLNKSFDAMDSMVEKIKEVPVVARFSKRDYLKAIRLFRDGEFAKSAKKFKSSLNQNPPRSIIDNLYFGLGVSYYKLNNYPQAIKQFDKILDTFPDGDKWFASNIMLGFIHNKIGDKSRAIYVLDKALKTDPPENVRLLIDSLLNLIEDYGAYASS